MTKLTLILNEGDWGYTGRDVCGNKYTYIKDNTTLRCVHCKEIPTGIWVNDGNPKSATCNRCVETFPDSRNTLVSKADLAKVNMAIVKAFNRGTGLGGIEADILKVREQIFNALNLVEDMKND